jgi:hypothetical protein
MIALSELCRCVMHGRDGDVGRMEDVYVDDQTWRARHLVADTRHWLRDRRVLIPPAAVVSVGTGRHRVEVGLTRVQVEHSPPIDTAKPVSRQHEIDLYQYFGFPYDWTGPAIRLGTLRRADPHLRSGQALTRCRVETPSGLMGPIADVLLDVDAWTMRYLVVRSPHGARELVAAEWVVAIDWSGRAIAVDPHQQAVLQTSGWEP